MPIIHRQIFSEYYLKKHEKIQTHCNNLNNLFLFACRKWLIVLLHLSNYLYK